jgi:hypothetical protein
MTGRTILPIFAAVAFASSAGWAQSTDDDPNQALPQKIRDKLAAQGFEDIKVAPSSYVVSARDKDGHRVIMMISPTSTTVMRLPDNPSTAQTPQDQDEIIQQ